MAKMQRIWWLPYYGSFPENNMKGNMSSYSSHFYDPGMRLALTIHKQDLHILSGHKYPAEHESQLPISTRTPRLREAFSFVQSFFQCVLSFGSVRLPTFSREDHWGPYTEIWILTEPCLLSSWMLFVEMKSGFLWKCWTNPKPEKLSCSTSITQSVGMNNDTKWYSTNTVSLLN